MKNNSTLKTQELAGVSPGTRGLTNVNSRNSWAPQHERRKSIRLLGKVVELDEWLDWRVKWGQRGTAVGGGFDILCFVLNGALFGGHNHPIFVAFCVFVVGMFVSMGTLYYKNFSFVIARRLFKEVNVVLILMIGLILFIIECVKPDDLIISPLNGFAYLFGTTLFVFLDAVKKKSRVLVLIISIIFALLNLYLIYSRIFAGSDVGVILFQYGDDYVFYKRSMKLSCFIQIFLFSLNGQWTMFKDKKMEMMMFATGNIYRETGTASKYVEDIEHAMRMRSETAESFSPQQNKNMNNSSTSKTQELAGVSPGTRGLTNVNSRNSWAPQHERRKSIRLLGKVVELDEWLDWRVKWGQRGTALCLVLATLSFLLNIVLFGGDNLPLFVAFCVCAGGVFIVGLGTLYYKNFSFVIARRLLEEVNVVIILMLAICNFTIDCAKPNGLFAPVNGFIYLLGTSLWLFLDAVQKKSRMFVLTIGILFSILTLNIFYGNIFGNSNIGVILFQYGDNYVVRKRSIKRSMSIQLLLFSLNGIWTMIKDKKMEMMMFATGNIYRETGTASKYVEDIEHAMRMRSETAESMV